MRATTLFVVCVSLTAFAGGKGGQGQGFGNAFGGPRGINPSGQPQPAPAARGASPTFNPYSIRGHSTRAAPTPLPAPAPAPAPNFDRDGHHHHHSGYPYGYGYFGYGGSLGYGYGYGYGYTTPYYPYESYGAAPSGQPSDYDYGSDYTEHSGGYQGRGGIYVDPSNPDDRELTGEPEPAPDESAGPGQLLEVSPSPAPAQAEAQTPAPAARPAAKPARPEKEPDIFHWVDADGTDHYSTDLPPEQKGKATKMSYDGSILSWTPVTSAEAEAAQNKSKQK